MPVVPIRVATFKIGATCVTGPFVSKLNVVASDPTVTVPSTDTLAADGADVDAPAGTFVKPPTVSIARPGVTLDSSGWPMINCPWPVPSKLVLIGENGATSSVPAGAVMVLAAV